MATLAALKQAQHDEPADSAGEVEATPVDLVHLSRFTLGNRDLEHEVLQLFRVQSRIYVDRLRAAPDRESWTVAAHTIKGSARGIGAWAVARAAETAERLDGAPGGEPARIVFGELAGAVDRACAFIDDLLANH